MMRWLTALFAGVLFGAGLVVSGMSDPDKVLNFLDVRGPWDGSLLFVMGAATLVAFIGYRLAWRRRAPVLEEAFHVPSRRDIDIPLMTGAALFGLGWGLAGYCPGPALTALVIAPGEALWFVGAMAAGMGLRSLMAARVRT